MFKIFLGTELIMTDSSAYNRIHANTDNDLQRLFTNENEFNTKTLFVSERKLTSGYFRICVRRALSVR